MLSFTPRDITHLSDADAKRLIMIMAAVGGMRSESGWTRVAIALRRALRARGLALLVLETDAMNVDEERALVGPDDDPIAEGRAQLRGELG